MDAAGNGPQLTDAAAGEVADSRRSSVPSAQQLEVVNAPAAPAAAQTVLRRLRAREAARAEQAACRLEQRSVDADPRESVAAFLTDFSLQRQALAAIIEAVGTSTGSYSAGANAAAVDLVAAKTALDNAAIELSELEAAVAEAAYFLPQYDLRQCTLAAAALREAHDTAAATLQPRKRFVFSRKSELAATAPAAVPAAAPVTRAAATVGVEEALVRPAGDSGSGTSYRGLHGHTFVHRCAADGTEDCTLIDLQDCNIFLLGPIAALFAHRLRRCRLCTGPVAGACMVEGALSAAARRWLLVPRNCCRAQLCTEISRLPMTHRYQCRCC